MLDPSGSSFEIMTWLLVAEIEQCYPILCNRVQITILGFNLKFILQLCLTQREIHYIGTVYTGIYT